LSNQSRPHRNERGLKIKPRFHKVAYVCPLIGHSYLQRSLSQHRDDKKFFRCLLHPPIYRKRTYFIRAHVIRPLQPPTKCYRYFVERITITRVDTYFHSECMLIKREFNSEVQILVFRSLSMIEFLHNILNLTLRYIFKTTAFLKVLPDQAIGIFI